MNKKISEKQLAELPIRGKQPESEKEKAFLKEMCEYEFYNLEEAGLSMKFPYGNTRNYHNFIFFHGAKYRLPRFIARHIESCSTPIWEWRPNGTGSMEKKQVGNKPRFRMSQVYG